MKDLAFAINCYDKITDVEIVVDILRKLYGRSAYIYVTCSDNRATEKTFAHLDLDFLEVGEPIDLLPATHPKASAFNPRLLQMRRVNQFARGMHHCAHRSGKSHTVNLHADAWPMTREGLETVIAEMKGSGKWFASYFYGAAYADPIKYPESMLTDIFFFADNSVVRQRNVFEYDHANYLSLYPNVHGYVSAAVKYTCGIRSVHSISDYMDALGWDGLPKRVAPFTAMGPLHFIPRLGFLHFAEGSFLPGWCYAILANYLVEYGFENCPNIRKVLERYPAKPNIRAEYTAALKARFGDRILDMRYLCDVAVPEINRLHMSLASRNEILESGLKLLSPNLHPAMQRYMENYEFLKVVADQINGGETFKEVFTYRIIDGGFRRKL